MNKPQASVSVAMGLVGFGLAVKHGWLGKTLNWTQTPSGLKAPTGLTGGNLTDWEAALIAWVILMLMCESQDVAQVAVPIAWALGLVEVIAALPTVYAKFPGTFAGAIAANPGAVPMQQNATPPPLPAPGTNG